MSAREKDTAFVVTASVQESLRCSLDKIIASTEGAQGLPGGGPTKEIVRIIPTDTGFDVRIPEGVTLTEAASRFIEAVRGMLKTLKTNEGENL